LLNYISIVDVIFGLYCNRKVTHLVAALGGAGHKQKQRDRRGSRYSARQGGNADAKNMESPNYLDEVYHVASLILDCRWI